MKKSMEFSKAYYENYKRRNKSLPYQELSDVDLEEMEGSGFKLISKNKMLEMKKLYDYDDMGSHELDFQKKGFNKKTQGNE